MSLGVASGPPAAHGRALFAIYCAPCHGPSGGGGYVGHSMYPPPIAGEKVATVVERVRKGGTEMPAFSRAVLPDPSLRDLAIVVNDTLARPAEPARFGPRAVDPFFVGFIVWAALMLLVCGLAALFRERRR